MDGNCAEIQQKTPSLGRRWTPVGVFMGRGKSNPRPAMWLRIVFLAQPDLVRFFEIPPQIPPCLSAVIGLDSSRCNLGQYRGTCLDFQATFQGNACQDFNKIFCHGDCPQTANSTDNWPVGWAASRGRMTISTSRSSWVMKCSSRSEEKRLSL